jgi:hypothetical protein
VFLDYSNYVSIRRVGADLHVAAPLACAGCDPVSIEWQPFFHSTCYPVVAMAATQSIMQVAARLPLSQRRWEPL